jgi:hypothetical protein
MSVQRVYAVFEFVVQWVEALHELLSEQGITDMPVDERKELALPVVVVDECVGYERG